MPDVSTIQIPKDVLQPIIDAHVSKAIMEALGAQSQLVSAAVTATLTMKVGSDGKPSSYSSDVTFLKWLVNSAIKEAVDKAVRAQLTDDMEHIKALVAKEMKNQRSPLTKQLIEGIAKAATDMGRARINVTIDTNVY